MVILEGPEKSESRKYHKQNISPLPVAADVKEGAAAGAAEGAATGAAEGAATGVPEAAAASTTEGAATGASKQETPGIAQDVGDLWDGGF